MPGLLAVLSMEDPPPGSVDLLAVELEQIVTTLRRDLTVTESQLWISSGHASLKGSTHVPIKHSWGYGVTTFEQMVELQKRGTGVSGQWSVCH